MVRITEARNLPKLTQLFASQLAAGARPRGTPAPDHADGVPGEERSRDAAFARNPEAEDQRSRTLSQANTCQQRAEAWVGSERFVERMAQPDELPRALLVGALEILESPTVIA